MKAMAREKRQADLYIQELKDRLAIFEKGNDGHHHHGRHHHHHHHKRHRPQTAGPATRAGRRSWAPMRAESPREVAPGGGENLALLPCDLRQPIEAAA